MPAFAHAVGVAGEDQAVRVFLIDQPSFDELRGEPVEQLGMRRRLAHDAEVVRRAHQAFAEVVVPDAIDDDAGGQRMLRAGEPCASVRRRRLGLSPARGNGGCLRDEHRRHAGRDLRARPRRLAADQADGCPAASASAHAGSSRAASRDVCLRRSAIFDSTSAAPAYPSARPSSSAAILPIALRLPVDLGARADRQIELGAARRAAAPADRRSRPCGSSRACVSASNL